MLTQNKISSVDIIHEFLFYLCFGLLLWIVLVCGMPPEYCEYGPDYEKCKAWLQTHLPEEFEKLSKVI